MQESLEKECESALRFAIGKEPQQAANMINTRALPSQCVPG